MNDELVVHNNLGAIGEGQARVNITWAGSNGDLPETVPLDATPEEVKRWATEAVRNGTVPGIRQDAAADFTDFVVESYAATEVRPFPIKMLRPKTPFGA